MKAYNIKTGGVRYTEEHDVTLMGRVLASDETSYWLKDAIKSSLERDIVDAVLDVEVLLTILNNEINNFDRPIYKCEKLDYSPHNEDCVCEDCHNEYSP